MSKNRNVSPQEPLAVVGMSCRFPGGVVDPESYWNLIKNKGDAISEVPSDRWSNDALFSEDRSKPGKTYIKWGGFLAGIDQFDPDFFGISPREAAHIDPQQRLLLEASFDAIEDAGQKLAELSGSRTGVYVGLFIHDYAHIQLLNRDLIDAYTGTGTSMSIAANRISYLFDLKGPSVAMDTACSSSLVALHQGCESLRSGECDMILAGGVNVILRPEMTVAMSKASMLSPDGRCHSFDSAANGYVRAEGVGMVVVKRLSDALRDGDRIHALLRSTASNQDGRTKGISVPSGEAQEALVREAQEKAGVAAHQIQYVEAHGTGTPVGDPIEANALGAVLCEGRQDASPCVLGSVKSNIGHTESASGMAGLIKVILALKNQQIPPNLHFHQPNPKIDLQALRLRVPTELEPWPDTGGGPRLACLNSFGFGGTNAHAIVEQAPETSLYLEDSSTDRAGPPYLVPLSAHDGEALKQMAGRLAQRLDGDDAPALRDVAATRALRRSELGERLTVVAASSAELREKLLAFREGEMRRGVSQGHGAGATPRIAFLFTGMGPQWWAMGRELLRSNEIFYDAVQEIDGHLKKLTDWSVVEELCRDETQSRLQETRFAQPAIFAVQVGLVRIWESWGIRPEAIAGHSVGEAAAAYASGCLSLEDAVRVVFNRSRLQHTTEGQGRMLAAGITEAEARAVLSGYEDRVAVAAVNSPSSVTLSGDEQALHDIEARLKAKGTFARFLQVPVPYHSPAMDPLREELIASLSTILPKEPEVSYYSTIYGERLDGPRLTPEYWWHNVRDTVLFGRAMELLIGDGFDTFVEIGPHPVLSRSVLECLAGRPGAVFPSIRRQVGELEEMLFTLGHLYCRGVALDWTKFYPEAHSIVELPSYPWQRQRYWGESKDAEAQRQGLAAPSLNLQSGKKHVLLGARLSLVEPIFGNELSTLSYVADHAVRGAAVYPGAAYLEMASAAIDALTDESVRSLRDIRFENALFWPDEAVQLQTSVQRSALSIHSRSESSKSWTRHMSATLVAGVPGSAERPTVTLSEIQARLGERMDAALIYPLFRDIGLDYGPLFQGITQVWRRRGEALAEIVAPALLGESLDEHNFHPALLDACLHTLFCTLSIDGEDADMRGDVYLPVSIQRFDLFQKPGRRLFSHCKLHERVSGERFLGDISIYDEDGALIAQVLGLVCQNLNRVESGLPEKLSRWLFEYRWEESGLSRGNVPVEPESTLGKTWLLYADGGAVAVRVAELFKRHGMTSVIVRPGAAFARLSAHEFVVNPASPEDAQEVVANTPGGQIAGVVHFFGLDMPGGIHLDRDGIREGHALGYGSALHLMQAVLARGEELPRFWFVTSGTQVVLEDDVSIQPEQAPLWGLCRVAQNEHSAMRVSCLDVGNPIAPSEVDALVHEFLADDSEDEVALRGTRRYVHRFAPVVREVEEPRPVERSRARYGLEFQRPGSFDGLSWRERSCCALGLEEIEIEVRAVGLNFKDVMKASGLLPQSVMEKNYWRRALGMECSGIVSRVGLGVTEFRVGDEVVAFAHHAFQSHAITKAVLAVRKPDHLSFVEAATVPLTFATAQYALHHQGRMQPGETVLIHAAAGGVGLAAMRLARRAGLRVFATAGSEEKREVVRQEGAELVMSSRDFTFAEEIKDATQGEGVDLILNSLAGEAIDRSLDVLAHYGRFLELGKIDIDANQRLGMRFLDRNASLHGIDLDRLLADRPNLAGQLLREVMSLFEQRLIQPLPVKTFLESEVVEAFRFMASAKHIGKIVVTLDDPKPSYVPATELRFRPTASYVVTGGFGGFGLELLGWLAERGAQHIVVLSRSGACSQDAQDFISRLRERGVIVQDERMDITDEGRLADLFGSLSRGSSPVKGVFHAAAILDDDLLRNQTLQKYEKVCASKLEGAWALHKATEALDLDHFVLFSSVTSVLGNQGSANYVAANCFVDALAHHRRQKNLVALTINWGLIANVGMAQKEPHIRRHLEANGLVALHTDLGLRLLEREMKRGTTQLTIAPVDFERWIPFHEKEECPRFFLVAKQRDAKTKDRGKSSDDFSKELMSAEPQDRLAKVIHAVRSRVALVFGTAPDKVDAERELTALGLDSLMALELRSKLEDLGLTVSVSALLESSTVNTLAPQVLAVHGYGAADGEEPAVLQKQKPKMQSRWVVTPAKNDDAVLRLICFPYAGGAPTVFHEWSDDLPEEFEVSSINLPGRARRITEPAQGSLYQMADEVVEELLPILDRPFAFFGHCMGSIIMYEVAERLQQRGLSPVRMFASGSMAPRLYQSSLVYTQPDPKFMEVLRLLDFTNTRSMLDDEEMRNLLMPTLRADFEAVVNYSKDFTLRRPLDCPITGFAAKKDLFAAPSSMVEWKDYTTREFSLHMLDVHHYFVETHRTYLTKEIAAQLSHDLGLKSAPELDRSAETMRHLAEPVRLAQEPVEIESSQGLAQVTDWMTFFPAERDRRVRLYCFPSSLGRKPGAAFLDSAIAEHAEICLIDPVWESKPGSLGGQARALAEEIARQAGSGVPFAFFGHCSGAILMYETARALRRLGAPTPNHLFASSAAAPDLYVMPNAHLLGDEKTVDVLDVIGHPLSSALRKEGVEQRKMIQAIRNDFEMMSTYQYLSEAPLDMPITVFRAENDLWTFFYGTEAWRAHTTDAFELITSEGDHFHIERDPILAIDVISRQLGWERSSEVVRRLGGDAPIRREVQG